MLCIFNVFYFLSEINEYLGSKRYRISNNCFPKIYVHQTVVTLSNNHLIIAFCNVTLLRASVSMLTSIGVFRT